ncbi:MAG: hypothetical protein IJR13_05250 [Bacteroidales bacterium]|nr:hypothetical protein [Bacteroidales bacterium]
MKRLTFFLAVAAFAFGMMTFTSCEKEENAANNNTPSQNDTIPHNPSDTIPQNPQDSIPQNPQDSIPQNPQDTLPPDPGPQPPAPQNNVPDGLLGTWKMHTENDSYTYIITRESLTVILANNFKRVFNYTYNDGKVNGKITESYTWEYNHWATYEGEDPDSLVSYIINLMDNNNVLALTYIDTPNPEWDENFDPYEEIAMTLYREGATITSDVNSIQGMWYWYMYHTNNTMVRVAVYFEGSNVTLYVPVWDMGSKYTGTYTYANGVLHMVLDKFYQYAGAEFDDAHPETAVYAEPDPNDPYANRGTLTGELDMPFFASGQRAYGIFANLSMMLYKQ